MAAQLVMRVAEGRGELVGAMDPAAIHDHDDLFPRVAEGRHHLMDILAQLLRIKVWDDFREDLGGAVLPRAQHTEPYAVGDPAPGAITYPRLTFEGFVACDRTLAQGACPQAIAWGPAPPASPGEGK